jgi:hypothetical protein
MRFRTVAWVVPQPPAESLIIVSPSFLPVDAAASFALIRSNRARLRSEAVDTAFGKEGANW